MNAELGAEVSELVRTHLREVQDFPEEGWLTTTAGVSTRLQVWNLVVLSLPHLWRPRSASE